MYSFLNKFIIIIIRCGNGDRMKKRLKEILYGFLFGISCLIPGFSGGTMLLILGIYENFTASLAKLSKKPIEAFKELWLYGKIHYKDLVSRKTGRQYEATVEMVDPGEGNVQFNLIFPQR